ncbi:ABC transporter substrate-binding protein [Staphylococcus aureus]
MRKLTKMSAMLLASGLILTGCGNKGLEEKKENKQLTYTTVKDIGDMNPHVYGGSMSAESMIYEPLVRNTKDGIKPLLAKKWDVSEDGKTYTFHLRDDVKFHDGTTFDADAVKKNIDAVQQNKKLHSWLKISTLIDNVKVKDKDTVELNLKKHINLHWLNERCLVHMYLCLQKTLKTVQQKMALKSSMVLVHLN